MTNRLPKYYIVFADLENPLWKKYIEHLNKIETFTTFAGNSIKYWYGFDGRPNNYSSKETFSNNPVELTLEQFFDLKKEVEPSMIKVTSTHKETVKSVAIHIEVEGQEIIDRLYLNICLVQGTLDKGYAGRVIELLDGIKSHLKV